MIILITYKPGLSGDFLSHTLHKNSGFKNIDDSIIDSYNRYFMPELLFLAHGTKDCSKTWSSEKWPDGLKESIQRVYMDESICITTHWDHDPSFAYFADYKIAIHTTDEITRRKAYAFWWIKSHACCTEPWKTRIEEVREEMPAEHAEELLSDYHNWKFLSYRMGIYPYDMKKYMKVRYENSYLNTNSVYRSKYDKVIDIKDVFDLKVKEILGLKIDSECVKAYVEKNENLLRTFGITVEGTLEEFIDSLSRSVQVRYELFKQNGVDHRLHDVKSAEKWLK